MSALFAVAPLGDEFHGYPRSGVAFQRERLGECAALATLNLMRCSGLTSLPDLSMLPNLEVKHAEYASDAAKEWKKGGFKRYPPA